MDPTTAEPGAAELLERGLVRDEQEVGVSYEALVEHQADTEATYRTRRAAPVRRVPGRVRAERRMVVRLAPDRARARVHPEGVARAPAPAGVVHAPRRPPAPERRGGVLDGERRSSRDRVPDPP